MKFRLIARLQSKDSTCQHYHNDQVLPGYTDKPMKLHSGYTGVIIKFVMELGFCYTGVTIESY